LVAWRLTAVSGPPFSSPDRGRRAVVEQNALFRPQTLVIEDRASGTQLIQDLIGDGLSHVARFSPDGDKIMRLHAQSAVIENGFVFLPEEAPWLADYLAELTAFPAGRGRKLRNFERSSQARDIEGRDHHPFATRTEVPNGVSDRPCLGSDVSLASCYFWLFR
jgi:hypothetical protein